MSKEKLMKAIYRNDLSLAKEALIGMDDYSFLNQPDEDGFVPFVEAVRNNREGDIVEFLYNLGGELFAMDCFMNSAFQYAGIYQSESIKKLLRINEHEELAHLANIDSKNSVSKIMEMIKGGLSVHARSITGLSLIAMACRDHNLPLAKFLLECGANPNDVDTDHVTPLMQAFNWSYSLDIAELLLEYGADIHAVSKKGDNIASFAAAHTVEALEWCEKHNVNMHVVGHYGFTPLTTASRCSNVKTVSFLLEKGLDPNHIDEFKKTPLIWAAEKSLKMVQEMIKFGADIYLMDKFGNTAKKCAEREGKNSIVKYLDKLENGNTASNQ